MTKTRKKEQPQFHEADRTCNNTMALKHTGLWLTIDGWVEITDIDNDKVFDTKPSHSHPLHFHCFF